MAQSQTQPYKRTMSGSIGAGFGSLVNGGRRYYILEHRTASAYHKAGESQKIIVDQVELGRSSTCQVRYDESFPTVSRRHAAIVKDGDGWKLVQLSETNSTYLNGQRVTKEWYLQNGDEIQLSTGGPKLGFIVPQGEKSMVKSIGLSQRLSLFRQQALRPYKRALIALSCIFVVALGVGGYFLMDSNRQLGEQKELVAQLQVDLDKEREANAKALADAQKQARQFQSQINDLKKKQADLITPPVVGSSGTNETDYVYYIYTQRCHFTFDGETTTLNCGKDGAPAWSGTGFLLENGYFVTARHVCQAWYYPVKNEKVDSVLLLLNWIDNSGGKVVYEFVAVSSSGHQFTFTSDAFVVDRSGDKEISMSFEDLDGMVSLPESVSKDYAYMRTSYSGGLSFNTSVCDNLRAGAKLHTWGFPLGMGVDRSSINPHRGEAVVGVDGLEKGVIVTTGTTFEGGNSGGPVFYTDESGKPVVIGLVSSVAGRSTGKVVPISVINK